mgnify:CR=1 FL=1
MASLCCGGPRFDLSKRGQMLMQALRGLICAEFLLSIVAILGTRYFDGALFILISLLFIYPLRDHKKAGSDIMCMFIFHAMQAVWSILYFILYMAGVQVYRRPDLAWRNVCLQASIYGLLGVFILSAVVSYFIFDEVRKYMFGRQNDEESINGLNRAAAPQDTHGRGGFGYDVENQQRSPSQNKKKEKKDDNWKKSGGNTLGQASSAGKKDKDDKKAKEELNPRNDPRNPWTKK